MTQTVVQFRGQPRSAAAPGTRLSDVYEIEDMIAAGGMGEIYRGKLIETGDPVAIKMIKPEFAENEAVLTLFRKEASALHRLHHDSIVRYYVFSVDRKLNRPYLAMEFVEGNTLSDILRDKALTLDEVNHLRKRVAAGLQVAHDLGIIHRDISPDNFILPDNDVRKAKIIDFGIARSTKLGQATVIGDGFAGKYNYVSPEQLGMHGGDVTNRSDMYSLGLVLAECLLGKPIDMGGSQVDVIDKRRAVPDLSGVDERLRPLLHRMLQPDPKDRPESMTEISEWVWTPPAPPETPKPVQAEKPAARARTASDERAADKPRSGSGLLIGGGAAALVVAAGLGWLLLRPLEPATQGALAPPAAVEPRPAASAPNAAQRPNPLAQRPTPTTPAERAERILHYIRYYDSDACLLLQPVAVTENAATIEAVAANTAAIRDFQTDFRVVNGFEPSVAASEAASQQCPAIDMMLRLDAHASPQFRMKAAKPAYKAGERVQVQIDGAQQRNLSLLLVQEDGAIRDLTGQLRQGGGGSGLEARIDDQGPARPSRKLLLAFAGPRRPAALDRVGQLPPDQFLKALREELSGMGDAVSASARVIRFE
jgi:eukaryotic-like serine/threonine-protein kinase